MSEDTDKYIPEKEIILPIEDSVENLLPCCRHTIDLHALYNPMMVCNECHQFIKCFLDEKSFRNYMIFCNTKRRAVATGKTSDYYIVVFDSSYR